MSKWIRSLIRGLLPAGGATRVRSFDRSGAACRIRPINEVAFHDPLHDAEHEFWMAWTINNSECAIKKRINKTARCLATSWLGRAHHHHWWRSIKSAKELQNARTGWLTAANRAVVERKGKINHCNVHRHATDHIRSFNARLGLNDIDAMGSQDLGNGGGPYILSPTTRCQQHIHEWGSLWTRTTAAAAECSLVGRLGMEKSKTHAQGASPDAIDMPDRTRRLYLIVR
jgi:hypothetical protein